MSNSVRHQERQRKRASQREYEGRMQRNAHRRLAYQVPQPQEIMVEKVEAPRRLPWWRKLQEALKKFVGKVRSLRR